MENAPGVMCSQRLQRKVNCIDSDYHYDNEKLKRNMTRIITECKRLAGYPRRSGPYAEVVEIKR
ncbi:hypothetical protein DK872_02030 [Kosakonia sp. MH5]|nr:hypothetical protein [Kosakonia sp. MH5]